ncbi:hypothetical protein TNCV_1715811 [Trichonephila clavipes]|nr:hypothetical protein TNCV_1715811 [Trichonephila clavipes]
MRAGALTDRKRPHLVLEITTRSTLDESPAWNFLCFGRFLACHILSAATDIRAMSSSTEGMVNSHARGTPILIFACLWHAKISTEPWGKTAVASAHRRTFDVTPLVLLRHPEPNRFIK